MVLDYRKLKNSYFILRHGESEGNVKKIIVSGPEGLTGFPLTEKGRKQVTESVKSSGLIDQGIIIYSSPFLRTKQTAEIASEILKTEPIIYTDKLKERFFGSLNGKGNKEYDKVWGADSQNVIVNHAVETVEQVVERVSSLILEIENKHKGKNILIVSHGDPLQILQALFRGIDPHKHHQEIPYVKTGEIRKLN